MPVKSPPLSRVLRKNSQVVRKDIADGQAEIVLHNASVKEMARPLTVVLNIQEDVGPVVALTPYGGSVKAWPCGEHKICVNVSVYDRPIRVTWGSLRQ